MMAGAKRELREAIGDLEEPQAELVLSLVHYLRASESGTTSPSEGDVAPSLEPWARTILLLSSLEGSSRVDEVGAILEHLEDERRGGG